MCDNVLDKNLIRFRECQRMLLAKYAHLHHILHCGRGKLFDWLKQDWQYVISVGNFWKWNIQLFVWPAYSHDQIFRWLCFTQFWKEKKYIRIVLKIGFSYNLSYYIIKDFVSKNWKNGPSENWNVFLKIGHMGYQTSTVYADFKNVNMPRWQNGSKKSIQKLFSEQHFGWVQLFLFFLL